MQIDVCLFGFLCRMQNVKPYERKAPKRTLVVCTAIDV